MKSCRRQNKPRQTASRQQAPRERAVPVHRYSHPIHAKPPVRQDASAGEVLESVLQALSRQSDLLEELLRRTGGDIPDTK